MSIMSQVLINAQLQMSLVHIIHFSFLSRLILIYSSFIFDFYLGPFCFILVHFSLTLANTSCLVSLWPSLVLFFMSMRCHSTSVWRFCVQYHLHFLIG